MKKLGFPQGTLFMWVKYKLWEKPQVWTSDLATNTKMACLSGKREYAYPAPTATEILEELPVSIAGYQYLFIEKMKDSYRFGCRSIEGRSETPEAKEVKPSSTPQEALGKMWCYLKKGGMVE